jgi:hypothetical protein
LFGDLVLLEVAFLVVYFVEEAALGLFVEQVVVDDGVTLLESCFVERAVLVWFVE